MNSLKSLLSRVRARLRSLCLARVVWLSSTARTLAGTPAGRGAIVAVVGREHYHERRKSYPIVRYADLARVIRLELAQTPLSRAVIGPPMQERRTVLFFDLEPSVAEKLPRAMWVLPESLLVAATLEEDAVAAVERDGLCYFVAGSGESLPRAGIVQSLGTFALAIGMSAPGEQETLRADDLGIRLWRGLRALPWRAWVGLFRAPVEARALPWRRIALFAGSALFAYLALGSAYLEVATRWRSAEIERLGPEVRSLLAQRTELDSLSSERRGIADLLADAPPSYVLWRVAAVAWQRGAKVISIQYVNGEVTLRARAPRATDVLEALVADGSTAAARFSTPVQRVDAGFEEFSVTVTLSSGANADER